MEHTKIPSVVITSIKFKNGQKIDFNSDDIVLLVGANNVGKSRTLKDLREDLIQNCGDKVLIEEVEYKENEFSKEQLSEFFKRNIGRDSQGNYIVPVSDDQSHHFDHFSFEHLEGNNKMFYKVLFSFLTTENRLNITRPIRFGYNIEKNSFNILRKLEAHTDSIKTLNENLKTAFDKAVDVYDYYVDDTIVKEYRIGKNDEISSAINLNEQERRDIIEKSEKLHEQGDGIRSAVAVLASLIVNEHSLFLIDEPESFLHPPQAKLIGKNLVDLSKGKQCFISTHDIDFIKGVVETDSSRVKIIKIDRIENNNTFNLISNDSIISIANDKNLKYTNILDGLFYDRLVLCENESDCKLYAAILENLDLPKYQNTLFCAVGGKDHFKKVIPLLKELSIQYLIIADIDLINNRGKPKQLLESVESGCYDNIREKHSEFLDKFEEKTNDQIKTQKTLKKEINDLFTREKYMSSETADKIKSLLKNISSLKLLKSSGKSALPQGECVTLFNDVRNYLKEQGIFILECGEIERFISDVSGHGNDWLENVFEKYSDINDTAFNDVKRFIREVFVIE